MAAWQATQLALGAQMCKRLGCDARPCNGRLSSFLPREQSRPLSFQTASMMASMMPGESRSAGKRRSHDSMDDSLDDMLAGLTTKLSSVTHADHDSLVATVCEVLGVDPGETERRERPAVKVNVPGASIRLGCEFCVYALFLIS